MKLNTWITALVVALAGLFASADSAKAQFYNYGYSYEYAVPSYGYGYAAPNYNYGYTNFGYTPGYNAFSNAYNPMTTSWSSMALYNNFYGRNNYGYQSSYFSPYTGAYFNNNRYGYFR